MRASLLPLMIFGLGAVHSLPFNTSPLEDRTPQSVGGPPSTPSIAGVDAITPYKRQSLGGGEAESAPEGGSTTYTARSRKRQSLGGGGESVSSADGETTDSD